MAYSSRSAGAVAAAALLVAVAAACGSFSGNDNGGATTSDAGGSDGSDGSSSSSQDGGVGVPDAALGDAGGLPSGTITKLASALSPQGLFVTDQYVYYTTTNFDSPVNEVARISKATGGKTIIASGEDAAQQVATVDDDYVFWTTWGSTGGIGPALRGKRVAVAGPALSLFPSPGMAWFAIAKTDANGILAAQFGGSAYLFPTGTFQADGGATYAPLGLTGDGGPLPTAFSHFVVAKGEALWTNETSDPASGVYAAPVDGGAPRALASNDPHNPWGLDANDTFAVYSTFGRAAGAGHVVRIERKSGTPLSLADGYTTLAGVVIVGSDVYFAEFVGNGTIWKVPLDGSSKAVAAVTGQKSPQSLAADATAIYWTNNDAIDGAIMRMQL